MKLIVVESPTKASALRGFLGRDYRILSTLGHIRDLPPKRVGVDIERDFRPTYWFLRASGKHGEFTGCTNFPSCQWTGLVGSGGQKEAVSGERCPTCNAYVVIRNGKHGRFRACSRSRSADGAPQWWWASVPSAAAA